MRNQFIASFAKFVWLLLQTKSFLRKNADDRASAAGATVANPTEVMGQLPAPGTKMTAEELEKVL